MSEMQWPPYFKVPGAKAHLALFGAGIIASLSDPRRRNVIQAGGCAGLWPLALSSLFDHVYTFEAGPTNFTCLQYNIRGVSNITAYDYALAQEWGTHKMPAHPFFYSTYRARAADIREQIDELVSDVLEKA